MADEQTGAVAVREWDDPLPELASAKVLRRYQAVKKFAADNLKLGQHFDVLPGEQWKAEGKSTDVVLADPKIKKFFTQAGADMLNMAWGIHSEAEIVSSIENTEEPHFAYTVKVTLKTPDGTVLGTAIGHCSSREVKYAYRWLTKKDIDINPRLRALNLEECKQKMFGKNQKYLVPNLEVADIANTLLQMAEKRAYVKITRRTHGISDMFNQPLDEFTSDGKKSGDDVHSAREEAIAEMVALGATEAELEEILGYALSRVGKNGIAYLEGLISEITSGDSQWQDILREARSRKGGQSESRPEPEKGKLSMDNVKPGDPATHTNVKEPMGKPQEPQAGLNLQSKPEPWEDLRADFDQRCAAMGMKTKAKEQASAACRNAAGINDWIEAETPEQIAAAYTWMDEFLTS